MAAGGKNRRFLIWLAIGTALLALATAALLTFLLNQRQLIAESRSLQTDSITALTHQAEREFMRYRQTLDAAVNSRKPPDDEALTLRHDIFLSRVNLLRENGPRVHLFDGVQQRDPADRHAVLEGALHGGGAPVGRQQGGVDVECAVARDG